MSYRAARLPRHRGPAAWNTILGPQPPARPLTAKATADVVVVGAGFAGLSAARRLLQIDPGLRVVVLEAGQVAEGAAGRNSGFMIDLPHDLTSDDYAGAGDDRGLTALNRHAIGFAREAVAEYQIDAAYFDPSGKVNGAASDAALAHNRSYAAHLESLGEPFDMLDAQAMTALTGSRHYLGGLYTPGTAVLQPAGYIRGLAAGLSDLIAVHEQSPVLSIDKAGTDWRVTTQGGAVTAPRVILATNGHLESFGIARGRLMHVMLFAIMTPALSPDQQTALGGAPRWGITPSDPMGTTLRRIDAAQGGPRIVVRTCAALRSGMEARASDLARAARVMQAKFDARFPQLAGLPPEYAWAGHLCLSRNGVSVMKEVAPGVIAACVQNGLGTARGTLTGIGAAELAIGLETRVTRHFGAEVDPVRLPPQPLRDWAGNMVLRSREWKAHAD